MYTPEREIDTAFDLLNRPMDRAITVADLNGTTSETFKYDSLSNIVHAENDESIVTRIFDSMSNMRSETLKFKDDDFEKTVERTYDAMGNVAHTEYPGGRTLDYAYDGLERIGTIHSNQGGEPSFGLLAGYDYLGAGRVERRNLPGNSTYTSYVFDTTGRVNATSHVRLNIDTTETVFDERTYAWDNAHNKTQRVEKIGGVAFKTYDYEYDALNRMWRSTKSLAAVAAGTPGSWSGDMSLSSASPGATSFEGGETITLSGDFDAEYDPETLGVYVSKDQGTADIGEDYAATIVSASATEIAVKTPPRGEQGTFDIYASAMDGVIPIYSNPKAITYGPLVTTYDLDGAGNRAEVMRGAETAEYDMEDETPAPADTQMNQYTQTPSDVVPRLHDGNGNPIRTGAALPTSYRHDYPPPADRWPRSHHAGGGRAGP